MSDSHVAPRQLTGRFASFREGLRAPFSGLAFLLRNPQLWPWALMPVCAALILTMGLGALCVLYVPALIERLIGHGYHWYEISGVVALKLIATATGLALSLLLSFAIAQPISSPALERLVRAVELEQHAPERPRVPLWREVARSAVATLLGLCALILVLAALLLIDLIIPFSWVVTFPLKVVVTGVGITWDLMDYPFSVRGWRLSLRGEWMCNHLGAVLGFGLALWLLLLIPCVQLLVLPVGVIGATWLVNRVDGTYD